jgi:peroxiredoxin
VRPTLVAIVVTTTAFAAPPKVGERHPDFTLPDIDTGKATKLSDFKGKKVLLVQFASW